MPILILAAIAWLSADSVLAQSFRHGGTEFDAVRQVTVPSDKPFTIVVVEFLHQGLIRPDGRNVAVAARNRDLVPFRVLQLGPGDFCRIAFQTVKGQSEYDIFYGGEPPRDEPPTWTCRDGLLLETRRFRQCNFNNLDSVRKAFEAAEPIGADYVENVFQGSNPFSLTREPFLSRYLGTIEIPSDGVYGFITSSQDCSFMLIDGNPSASAPGHHGPRRRAVRGIRRDMRLTAGPHMFEYYHAAAGPNAIMAAYWEIGPADEKPQNPVLIPGEAFRSRRVGHLPAGNVSLRTARLVPDFLATIAGDVPLPDNDVPLVGVQFHDASPKPLTMQGAKIEWDFGDGQKSGLPNPDHVYLRPGLYAVKLSIRRGGKTLETTNRIYVDRPGATSVDKPHALDDYLRIVESYDPRTLDAVALRQLALAFEAKSLALADSRPAELERWLAKAVAAGRAAFTEGSAARGDGDLLQLFRLIVPMVRFRLGDSQAAFEIARGAAERMTAPLAKAECETSAADAAVNDLIDTAAAKSLLDAARKNLAASGGGSKSAAAELHRVGGDYLAATGDGKAARKEYLDAQQAVGDARSFTERTAWLGARARSAEDFLKLKQYVRAIEELWAWQRDFPSEKLDGYWTLLFARYWLGREKYAQAIAQAERMQAVNADSPYMDQLLYIAAGCEMRRGRKDRALATLESLVKDYPGSPLVPAARRAKEKLRGEKGD